RDQQQELSQLMKQFEHHGTPGGFIDSAALQRDIEILNRFGLKIEDVDKAFGSASISTEQFDTRVKILTQSNLSAIDTLSQMVDWAQVLTEVIHAFTDAIAGAVAGTNDLGRALLVGFFQIIGEIATTLGTLFILAAAGFAFIPGLNWSAGQLAA